MLTRMVLIAWPPDPPASASQSAGITGVSHRARPQENIFLVLSNTVYISQIILWDSSLLCIVSVSSTPHILLILILLLLTLYFHFWRNRTFCLGLLIISTWCFLMCFTVSCGADKLAAKSRELLIVSLILFFFYSRWLYRKCCVLSSKCI